MCLGLYRAFFRVNHIPFIEYDYDGPITPNALKLLNDKYIDAMSWWYPMWKDGWGCVGSSHPKVLLVAERQGPNNTHNVPFETGPTGRMLSEMLDVTKTPFGDFAITNMVKDVRRSTRRVNRDDILLLRKELEILKPDKVVFMGSVAKAGIPSTNSLGIPHYEIVHLGFHNYRKTADMTPYYNTWREIVGIG